MLYLWIKWAHVLSSTILFGTGIGTAFFMFMANRRKDVAGIAFAARHVVIADWIFTTPAVIIQLLTGLWLVHLGDLRFSAAGSWAGCCSTVLPGHAGYLSFGCRSRCAT